MPTLPGLAITTWVPAWVLADAHRARHRLRSELDMKDHWSDQLKGAKTQLAKSTIQRSCYGLLTVTLRQQLPSRAVMPDPGVDKLIILPI